MQFLPVIRAYALTQEERYAGSFNACSLPVKCVCWAAKNHGDFANCVIGEGRARFKAVGEGSDHRAGVQFSKEELAQCAITKTDSTASP
jgi:hypothetical protein